MQYKFAIKIMFISVLIVLVNLCSSLCQALSKTLTADELYYLREQFALLEPSKNGSISLENINKVDSHTISTCKKFIVL